MQRLTAFALLTLFVVSCAHGDSAAPVTYLLKTRPEVEKSTGAPTSVKSFKRTSFVGGMHVVTLDVCTYTGGGLKIPLTIAYTGEVVSSIELETSYKSDEMSKALSDVGLNGKRVTVDEAGALNPLEEIKPFTATWTQEVNKTKPQASLPWHLRIVREAKRKKVG